MGKGTKKEPWAPPADRLRYYKKEYYTYHVNNVKRFGGKVTAEQVQHIIKLVAGLPNKQPRLLDYGSGKGYQYLRDRIHESWGGILPFCYDPGVYHLARRPEGKFDGVICLDVLEHIEEEDLGWILTDIFEFVRKPDDGAKVGAFVYLHICCRPAHKYFPDGRNVHRTIQPPEWWEPRLRKKIKGKGYIQLVTSYEELSSDPLDVCECGDYRRDHKDGIGPCVFNGYDGGPHGDTKCLEFRLLRPATEDRELA